MDAEPQQVEADEWVCGENYDHTLEARYDRDGELSSYDCVSCGAELIVGVDDV